MVAAGRDGFDRGFLNVSGWTDVIAISAGTAHTIGLRADGTVIAVGVRNAYLGVGDWTDIRTSVG